MAAEQQAIYDDYVSTYGKPKQAKHLIAFSKKQGKNLKFSDAKRLLLDNMNRDKDKDIKRKQKAQPKHKPKSKPANKTNGPKLPISSAINTKNNKPNGIKPKTIPNRNTKPVPKRNMKPKPPNMNPKPKRNMKPKRNTKAKKEKRAQNKSQNDPHSANSFTSFASLSGAIKPLSSIKPIEVIQKTDDTVSSSSNGSQHDDEKRRKMDEENDRKYKTMKSKKAKKKTFKKQKGTGSTPKPIAIDTKAATADNNNKNKKKKKKKKRELRRKLTPIPPPSDKGSVLSLASKFEKEGKKKKDRQRKSQLMQKKRKSNKSKKKQTNKSKKGKKKEKWDGSKEREVCQWFNGVMAQEILKLNGGKAYLRGILANGQLLCRLINKLSPQTPAMIDARVIKQKPNIIRYDCERIASFIACCVQLGLNSDDVFSEDALRSGASQNVMSVVHTLCCLQEEISSPKKQGATPLALWCSYNEISTDIYNELVASEYDLRRLFLLKSDEIEKSVNCLSLNDKLSLMKCIVRLKQENENISTDGDGNGNGDTEWIVLKQTENSDIYCNLSSKQILNANVASDAQQLMAPFVEICGQNHVFLMQLFEKYFDAKWFVDGILSFISRLPQDNNNADRDKIKDDLCEIDFDNVSLPIAISESQLFGTDLKDMHRTKLSYNLMELLTAAGAVDETVVAAFIDRYASELIFHSLCVFHAVSCGNAYHARIICDFLLDKYCTHLLSAICTDPLIALLLRYAICSQLAHGNLNSFILELVSFTPRTDSELRLKKKVIDKFISWNLIHYVSRVACSNNGAHETYALFLTDLLARCAFDAESHRLFLHFKVSSLLDTIIRNKQRNMNRITCAQTVCAMLDILKMPSLLMENEEKMNYLHSQLFESSLRLICDKYFDKLCAIVLREEGDRVTAIHINCGVISSPFGALRFHCLQVIGITTDLSMLNAAVPLAALSQSFWKSLFDLLFIHANNNFFLNEFRRLIHLAMLFRRRILKYLCLKCNLLSRFLSFYQSDSERTELHAFILQMLWNFYSNDNKAETRGNLSAEAQDQFNISTYFESEECATQWDYFVVVIENEMNSRVLTQDIDLSLANVPPAHAAEEDEEEEEAHESMDENINNDDIFNWNPFRQEIMQQNAMPNAQYLSHFGLFRDYRFEFASHSYAQDSGDVISIHHYFARTSATDAYLMFDWNINSEIVQRQLSKGDRDALNLMIVLDHSVRMSHAFKSEKESKMAVTAHVLGEQLLHLLRDNDRIGLISFDHEAYLEFDLTAKSELSESNDIANCIAALIANCSDTDDVGVDEAYYRAVQCFEDIDATNTNTNINNRILFITTREPSDLHSLLSRDIGTTFVSLSREFNLSNQSQIAECAACNYFHIQSRKEFVQSITADGGLNVYQPIFFDVELYIANNADNESPVVERIFGGMMNDNEREYRCKSGNIESHKTLFANCCHDTYRYNLNSNNIKVIKIKSDSSVNEIKISIHIQQHQIYQYIAQIPPNTTQSQYDNDTIKKAVLLTDYLNLLKEWRQSQSQSQPQSAADGSGVEWLNVSEEYKMKFKKLLKPFEETCVHDPNLQNELNVLHKLADFDEEQANIIRDLAKYDR